MVPVLFVVLEEFVLSGHVSVHFILAVLKDRQYEVKWKIIT